MQCSFNNSSDLPNILILNEAASVEMLLLFFLLLHQEDIVLLLCICFLFKRILFSLPQGKRMLFNIWILGSWKIDNKDLIMSWCVYFKDFLKTLSENCADCLQKCWLPHYSLNCNLTLTLEHLMYVYQQADKRCADLPKQICIKGKAPLNEPHV